MLTVRSGKGDKDRPTILPVSLRGALEEQLQRSERLYSMDREEGIAGVWLPGALDRKFRNGGKEWAWFWVFPSDERSVDPEGRWGVRNREGGGF